jgi:mannose-6-phosphate isomerase-like protein (cupin superfamily)
MYGEAFNRRAEEVVLVTGGEGQIWLDGWLDGRTLAVRANSMSYLPAGDEHEICAAAAQGLEFFVITAPAFSPDNYVQLPS